MTTDTYQLRTLIAKWRGTHGSGFTSQGEFQAHISTLRTCADELEAAIAGSVPQSATVGVEDVPIDASDNAEYIEHCADRLERCGLRVTAGALRVIAHEHRSLAQQPAAPSGEAVAWLRMKPDGTPDWAEDCIGSDDRFLDHELASDGYYLQPLYTAPQQQEPTT